MRISERTRDGSASASDSSDGESAVKKPIFKIKRPTNLRKRVHAPDPEEVASTARGGNSKEDSPPPFKKRAANVNAAKETGDAQVDDDSYKGLANYKSFIKKNPDAPVKKVGPLKAPSNVRTITIQDYNPEVCKDYKQTGFCGFGDSCKFLHAREDYKQGWQLDREWETVTKGKNLKGQVVSSRNKNNEAEDSDDEALLEGIPFACVICKEDYKNPIVTKCGHYFCEACALKRFKKTPACVICGTGTGGVFNGAKRLRKLLEKKRAREEAKEAREAEEAEEE